MAIRDDPNDRGFDREILDIIPERFDSDADSRQARKSAHTRLILTVALSLLAVAALGVAARHILVGEAPKERQSGPPVIHADDRPIKTKPVDRGGMDVPNQDKMVYERMGAGESERQAERLLPPPEQPQAPPAGQPRTPSIKPAFPAPPPAAPSAAPALSAPAPAPVSSPPPPSPAPAQKQAALPTPAKPMPSAPAAAAAPARAGGWVIQLGALRSEADAKAEWTRVRSTHKDILGELSDDILRVDLGAKGIFWRLRAGPVEEAQARTLCAALIKQSQGCIIARK